MINLKWIEKLAEEEERKELKLCRFASDTYYSVFNSAVGWEQMFRITRDYNLFIENIYKYFMCVAHIYAYCLTHYQFHIFLRTKTQQKLKEMFWTLHPGRLYYDPLAEDFILQQFANACNSYAKSYNNTYERKGKLFLDSLERTKMDNENLFCETIQLIHQKPVTFGLCDRVEDWKHSSYLEIIGDHPSRFKKEQVLNWFGGKEKFIFCHNQHPALITAAQRKIKSHN